MELAQRGQASFTDADMTAAFDMINRIYTECAQEGAIAAPVDTTLFGQLFSGQAASSLQFTGTPWFGFVADVRAAAPTSWPTGRHVPGARFQGPRGHRCGCRRSSQRPRTRTRRGRS